MNNQLAAILESYREEMVETLCTLVRIPSVLTEPREGAPYGLPIKYALDAVFALGKEKGFECINFDNHACEINLPSPASDSVAVVSHLDVVPAGSGWTRDPFGGEYIGDKIYGRGTVDDKGPLVAAFYACLALWESGLPLTKKIKHIIGTNEESGSFPCLEYYKTHAEIPSVGIVPDSWFPAVYAEKGFLSYQFRREFTDSEVAPVRLLSISGGEALNMVAAEARARIEAGTESCDSPTVGLFGEKIFSALSSYHRKDRIEVRQDENVFTVTAYGTAAHASTHELGENAISLLLDFLAFLRPLILPGSSPVWETIEKIASVVGKDTNGAGLGILYTDSTGDLTNNVGLISFQKGLLTLGMNLRIPVTYLKEELESALIVAADSLSMEYRLLNYNPHYYIPKDDPLICLLTSVYQDVTGDLISQPKAHGGGSYARIFKNFVPFGPSMQDEPLVFHKQDEYITGQRLLLLSKIYAEALYLLAR